MRILVCGSRTWEDAEAIKRRLALVPYVLPDVPTVVHGGAWGADTMAAKAARALGMFVEEHPADWDTHGKRAGFLRNVEMLESGVDVVIAFQRGKSAGTQHTINEARKRGLRVEVHSESC